MTNALLLLFMGLFLIFLEFFLPGIILGTIGSVLVLASIYLAATSLETSLTLFLFVVSTMALLAATLGFAIWIIPRAGPGRSIYLKGDQTGYVASSYDKAVIGKEGKAITDLRPGGYIEVEGKELVALSQSGYILKGTAVKVIGGDGESLQVTQLK